MVPDSILICGTAAAEGWPALFCQCEPCAKARETGGKNLRSRAAYQIGETIRIDFGPDSNFHQQKYALPFEKLKHLLMSHSHWDHWTPQDLNMRRTGFARIPEGALLHIYGNAKVKAELDAVIEQKYSEQRLEFHRIEPWAPISLDDGVVAIPLLAAHDRSEQCVNWLVESEGVRFLQGHDTGWWDDETWRFLTDHPVDIVAMDCTCGSMRCRTGHLGCEDVVEVRKRLQDSGALRAGARFIATHFSHNGGWLHDELEQFFAPHDIEVAFDGMRLPLKQR